MDNWRAAGEIYGHLDEALNPKHNDLTMTRVGRSVVYQYRVEIGDRVWVAQEYSIGLIELAGGSQETCVSWAGRIFQKWKHKIEKARSENG